MMQVELNKQEAWKILDAINSYTKDYTVTGSVQKTFDKIISKLKSVVDN